jgi:perosamine synthetase
VTKKITPQTTAIIAVDYAGQPCDYDALWRVAKQYNLHLIADACHAMGGKYKDRTVGTLAELSTFSLHPVKPITSGEGGMITTDNLDIARWMRAFRNHGITSNHRVRDREETWFYEMMDLGYNYRLSDFQCALGTSQLSKVLAWVDRRQEIARSYDQAFSEMPEVSSLKVRAGVHHAYHLYVIRLNLDLLRAGRALIFRALRAEGIGVNVHYIPVHLHPFYRRQFGTHEGQCPVAEAAYETILSLPIFPRMSPEDVDSVVVALRKVIGAYRR